MTNIHTLSSLDNNGGRYSAGRGSGSLPMTTSDIRSGEDQFGGVEPRCIDVFFPGFTLKSFVFWVSMVQIAVFIAECVYGSYALKPTGDTLYKFGDSYGPPIQAGEIWRLFNPIFLHASIWHLAFNVFFQLRMGFSLEARFTIPKIAALYFASGIAGNLLSVAWAPCKTAVGASTAGFGLIGLQLSEIALAWHTVAQKGPMIYNIVAFVVISVMVSAGPRSVVDWRGHLGGAIAGFGLGLLYCEDLAASLPGWYKQAKPASIGVLAVMYIACTTAIFAVPMSQRCAK